MKRTPLSRGTKQLKRSGFKQKATIPLKKKSKPSTGITEPRKTTVKSKLKSTAKLKKELDAIFSKFVRFRDANQDGYGKCYTCGKLDFYKNAHCGHWIPRNILITRWNENNCRWQCIGCNLYGNGKFLDFEDHLIKDLGIDIVTKLKQSRFQIFKIDRIWYNEKIEYYKIKVKEYETKTIHKL